MSRPNAQSMKPATAAKKLDVYLPATPAEFRENQITREDQDAFALQSQMRAAAALEAGYFASQIAPVEVMVKRDKVPFVRDEHPKATTAEALAGLRPVFQKDGTVTAGNASGINDGAAAIVLASADAAIDLQIRAARRAAITSRY